MSQEYCPRQEQCTNAESFLSWLRDFLERSPLSNQSLIDAVFQQAEDPRPLRDRAFHARMADELSKYLNENDAETEMKHSLGLNTLKSPTQKDFNAICTWLCGQIDPDYRFQDSLDSELRPILRELLYPYGKKITKSQISAVGGPNWFTFLGMLHWLMQLAKILKRHVHGDMPYDEACREANVQIAAHRSIFRFIALVYHKFLQGGGSEDDETVKGWLSPLIQQLSRELLACCKEELLTNKKKARTMQDKVCEQTNIICRENENSKSMTRHTKNLSDRVSALEQLLEDHRGEGYEGVNKSLHSESGH